MGTHPISRFYFGHKNGISLAPLNHREDHSPLVGPARPVRRLAIQFIVP